MPPASCSEVRSGIASAVARLSGWTESRLNPALFPSDTQNLAHHAFCVEVQRTEPLGDRQRLREGTNVISTVSVQWAHRIRGDAQVSDYGLALDAELDLIQTLLKWPPTSTHVVLGGISRRWTEDGTWMVGRVDLRVVHLLALE